MSKRTTFTTISPLPAGISREAVLDFLHNHLEMIDLNPLIKERHIIKPPAHAPPEEHSCVWYSLTDEISYLPGGLATSDVSYTCAFHDLPTGLQTHCYAPMGLEIRDKWTVAGSLPGEPIEPVELGIGAPLTGLYLREDVDMRCNVFTTSFVKKTLKKSHGQLVERIKSKIKQTSSTQPQPQTSQFSSQYQPSHGRHHSHNSATSGPFSSSSHTNSPRHTPPPQTHRVPSYTSLTNQMDLPYRPPRNKSSPAPPSDGHTTSAYPRPLHIRHASKGAPTQKPSWPDIRSQQPVLNNYTHAATPYDVNTSHSTFTSPFVAGMPGNDAKRRAERQRNGQFIAELE
ncbi:uncharacterized protein CTRU02_202293 [Colletotrichum truncatum]|uniref:Uncharacterized protein n=1 Tax=Colletotrichum truncatum TaxID=5467 RepID=A0ACC3ZJV9_COLTU|nr:uncharacterized protein CTRU02_01452 [Colletotrichum truncatum]KAF6799773.1 hypothetical protein CTRU02_01452 [Colletotrichum truncatum]